MSKTTPTAAPSAAPAAAPEAAAAPAAAPTPAPTPAPAAPVAAPAAAAAPAEEPAPNYRVISRLNHDLVDYEPGAKVYLTKKQAAPLLGHTVKPLADEADDE